jgi:hypothetical protein
LLKERIIKRTKVETALSLWTFPPRHDSKI